MTELSPAAKVAGFAGGRRVFADSYTTVIFRYATLKVSTLASPRVGCISCLSLPYTLPFPVLPALYPAFPCTV